MNSPTRSRKVVSIANPSAREITPLLSRRPQSSETMNDSSDDGTELFERIKYETTGETSDDNNSNRNSEHVAREGMLADRLSMRLLEVDDDDDETELRILRESLDISLHYEGITRQGQGIDDLADAIQKTTRKKACQRLCTMLGMSLLVFCLIIAALYVGVEFIGPPNQPVGPYQLVERQEGEEFFQFYNFYDGPDSVGSNGYNSYVSWDRARQLGIVNVTKEQDVMDVYYNKKAAAGPIKEEPFLYVGSSPTKAGPRESIRLEGKQRFNRGLFIIDVRHMPAGCGVWPAFWLTDEANWPVNGEIDIVEGVNYQSQAKTALHSTKGCSMDDVPIGVKKGGWDSASGIPNKKTGIPDMTVRDATNCFVYDPHQWLNQGCVAVDIEGDSLGQPLNAKGGGVFALEWDPVNRHIRTWVFSPHVRVPENLVQAIRTAGEPVIENRVLPDPQEWPLPYGYFAVGDGTSCEASHFRNMRLVLNTAFCGSVCGNRYNLDCKNQSKSFSTCNNWIKSQPKELDEAYWKIRGVYVYQREWEKAWVGK